jgi:hypothetical protein
MTKKHQVWTLEELKNKIGEEQIECLFLEHYLEKIGKNKENKKIADDYTIDDIME